MKLSYKARCKLFTLKKTIRKIFGIAALIAFIYGCGAIEKSGDYVGGFILCFIGFLVALYLYCTNLHRYTKDGVKIWRIKK